MSAPTGPGETPGRDWRSLPPETVYSLLVTRAGEVVEVITVTRAEWHVAKQIVGEIRREHWINLAPTLTWEIMAKRFLSFLVGASAALVALKWKGHLAASWWVALSPFLAVVVTRLVRWCLLRYRQSRDPLHVSPDA